MSLLGELQKSFLKRAIAKASVSHDKRVAKKERAKAEREEIKALQAKYAKLDTGNSFIDGVSRVGNFAAKMLESQDRFYAEDKKVREPQNINDFTDVFGRR